MVAEPEARRFDDGEFRGSRKRFEHDGILTQDGRSLREKTLEKDNAETRRFADKREERRFRDFRS
jgi:hypothetical protein